MWVPILGLIVGLLIGSVIAIPIPASLAKYLSIAVLAALDSAFGSIRAIIDDNEIFDATILLTGFFTNTLFAALLTYLGDQLGIDIYLAAVFTFGVRLFQNLSIIRRHAVLKWENRRENAKIKREQDE